MTREEIAEIKRATRGKWHFILMAFGMKPEFLKNKHGPCPFCGGRDRWRWDNRDGMGSGFCNQCDATGDGFHLVAKMAHRTTRGKDFIDVVKSVGRALNILTGV